MDLEQLVKEAEAALTPIFARIDAVAERGTARVLSAFKEARVSAGMFAPTDGYGYDDRGRDTLDEIYARVFDAEAAFVRHSILSGTHGLNKPAEASETAAAEPPPKRSPGHDTNGADAVPPYGPL